MGRPVDPRLLRASRAARRHLTATAVLSALAALTIVAQAVFLGRVVAAAFLDGAGVARVRDDLIGLAVAVAARAALMGAFQVVGHRGATRAMSDLRARLAHHMVGRGAGAGGETSGELATAAVQGVDALEGYFAGYLPQLMMAVAVPVAALAWIVPADRTAGLIILITLPIVIVFMILIGLGARARAEARWRALGDLGGHFLDVVRGLATLRAHNRAEQQAQIVARVGERYHRETMGTLRIAFLSSLVLELAASLAVAMVAVTIGVRLAAGDLTFAAGFTVLLLTPEVFAPVRAVGAKFHASADGLAAAERIFRAIGDAPADAGQPATPPAGTPLPETPVLRVALRDVHHAYPAREGAVLAGVDLELRRGERVALVGPSGAGKSTVVAVLLGLVRPDRGRVVVDGRDLADLDMDDWRRRVAWVPQRARLFRGSIADNVRLGRPDADDARVRGALAAAGAGGLIAGLPDGIATMVGDGGRRLSAGETQRIALARALVRDADVMILDEPTAHLDPECAGAVAEAVARLSRDRILLVVTHRDDMLAVADRVVALDAPAAAAPTASESDAAVVAG